MSKPIGNMQIAEYGKQTQFKKGHKSKGARPIGTGMVALQAKLDKYLTLDTPVILPDGTKDRRAVIDAAILALAHKATRGDIAAIKELLDRYYGKTADKVELTGKDGEALKINNSVHLEQLYAGMKDAFDVEAIEEK